MSTDISSTTVQMRVACSNASTSNFSVSSSKNLRRFMDARLQAVSSRNMYSEHGLDALILPPSGQVCHSFIVVSNCTPGSAHAHAPKLMSFQSLRADTVLIVEP